MMRIPPARIEFTEESRKTILAQIDETLISGALTLGRFGREFERSFSHFIGTEFSVAVNSGTAALEAIFRAIDIKGRDVLVPANTFLATIASVIHAGGNPILYDLDADGLGVTVDELTKRATPNTAAVVVVHIAGIICELTTEVIRFCADRGIPMIEDAAHAHGSILDGKMAGTFGIAAAFSFYPTKVMTSAEGGMVTTNDEKLCKSISIMRDQGKAEFEQNFGVMLGSNWRLSEPHAIIGLNHLRQLPRMLSDRVRIAHIYDKELAGLDGIKPIKMSGRQSSNYYKYIVMLDERLDRNRIKNELREKFDVNLSGEVYALPVHRHPVFRALDSKGLDHAETFCQRHICLPIYSGMEGVHAQYVMSSLKAVLSRQ